MSEVLAQLEKKGGGSGGGLIDLLNATINPKIAHSSYSPSSYVSLGSMSKGTLFIMTGFRDSYQTYATKIEADGVDITNTEECVLNKPDGNSFFIVINAHKNYSNVTITYNRVDRMLTGAIIKITPN